MTPAAIAEQNDCNISKDIAPDLHEAEDACQVLIRAVSGAYPAHREPSQTRLHEGIIYISTSLLSLPIPSVHALGSKPTSTKFSLKCALLA